MNENNEEYANDVEANLGDRVLYNPPVRLQKGRVSTLRHTATICCINDNDTVNLSVIDILGGQYAVRNVLLVIGVTQAEMGQAEWAEFENIRQEALSAVADKVNEGDTDIEVDETPEPDVVLGTTADVVIPDPIEVDSKDTEIDLAVGDEGTASDDTVDVDDTYSDSRDEHIEELASTDDEEVVADVTEALLVDDSVDDETTTELFPEAPESDEAK